MSVLSQNFDTRTQRATSFFDGTTYLYLWKNSEVDPNNQDLKVLYDDVKADIRGENEFTTGSVFFAGATGQISEDNSNFFYDDTLNFLGIGLNTGLQARLHVKGVGATSASSGFYAENSASNRLLEIEDGGTIRVGSGSSAIITTPTATATLSTFNILSPTFISPLNFGNQAVFNAKITTIGGVLSPTGADHTLTIHNGGNVGSLLPNTSTMYCDDAELDNATMFVRTETGDIIKLYSISGWAQATGTATRTTFDTSTVTVSELAERVKALIDDLYSGNIGLLKS